MYGSVLLMMGILRCLLGTAVQCDVMEGARVPACSFRASSIRFTISFVKWE